MQIGLTFPQTEIGQDPIVLRDYAQAAEGLGYQHLLAYEHITGLDPTNRPDWGERYTYKDAFYEPFVLFSYLGALTSRIEFVTGILILPQRETALVAKQAATVDVLTGGRLKLGIGIGYNEVEYQSVGADFATRGRRVEEQIELLRLFWTQPVVDFEGKWHRVDRVGINPMPVRRPIPLFMGGVHDRVLDRAARLADGWFPMLYTPQEVAAFPGQIARLKAAVAEHGRDPDEFEIRIQVNYPGKSTVEWVSEVEMYRDIGVDYLCFNTMNGGLGQRQHIEAIEEIMRTARTLAGVTTQGR